ncbi:gamma-butyrobetaine hydroxylase-like domain-containing protein [Rhodoplanes azumiensis]|uniref:Gamma-butyrobetaine hydroxylase-like domain-containing protein n=1 Tax=Rhodoplanes azumiensis TaxID=1897628 RepID=A0ABW5APQ0_9BRAD
MSTTPADQKPWPTELRLRKDRRALEVTFESGERFVLPAEILRVRSPSAEVQGHSPAERKLVAGKRAVEILEIQPTGNYAVRLVFDDMHDSGIFSWDYLLDCGRNLAAWEADYAAEIAAAGLSRDPPARRG